MRESRRAKQNRIATEAGIVAAQFSMRDLTDEEWAKIRAGSCPFCNGHSFLRGPSGGDSTNWFCANDECRAGFNLTTLPTNFGNQLIREPK